MNRRIFLVKGGKGLGAISLGMLGIYSCRSNESSAFNEVFSWDEINLINEMGEIIIPTTDTPGAKAARVGEFIAVVVQDCFSEKERKDCKATLEEVNRSSNDSFGKDFLQCEEQERIALITKMEDGNEGYKTLKNLILSAYLSSEIGTTQFFNYHPVPGRYDGCTAVRPW